MKREARDGSSDQASELREWCDLDRITGSAKLRVGRVFNLRYS